MNAPACNKLEDYFSPETWRAVVSVCPGLEGLVPGGNEVRGENAVACLEPGPKGSCGLTYATADKTLRLASALNPEAEDRALIKRAGIDPSKGVLCFGLGLGYYLEELGRLMKPETPLWVMESRPELAACALRREEVRRVFKRPGARLFVGPFHDVPWADEAPPSQELWRPATARNFAADYPRPDQKKSQASPKAKQVQRVLLFQGGYFLDRELQNAAAELGLETAVWHFQRGLTGDGQEFNELLSLIKKFRPEMILTVNHLGFDAEGLLEDIFTLLNLPVATWFVDSPVFILKDYKPGPLVTAFTWDSDYSGWLKQKGFRAVHYLPLAADNNFFKPSSAGASGNIKVSFVGDSLTEATNKYLKKIFTSKNLEPQNFLLSVDLAAEEFLNSPDLVPNRHTLNNLIREFDLYLPNEQSEDLAALVTWRASRIKRVTTLKAFDSNDLTVVGDEHWKDILDLPKNLWRPPVDYYSGLADFYRTGLVNLNITSAQMKSGLNQRVFDVPACGAFVLSDHQKQLFDLFDPGSEVVTYQDPAEAVSLSAWYSANDIPRKKIIEAAQRRVLSQHLYRHRLSKIIELMSK